MRVYATVPNIWDIPNLREDAVDTGTGDWAMTIESTAFGSIAVDGKTYGHDAIVRLSGEVIERKKELSKKHRGTTPEAEAYFAKMGCEVLLRPAPEAIGSFNRLRAFSRNVLSCQ